MLTHGVVKCGDGSIMPYSKRLRANKQYGTTFGARAAGAGVARQTSSICLCNGILYLSSGLKGSILRTLCRLLYAMGRKANKGAAEAGIPASIPTIAWENMTVSSACAQASVTQISPRTVPGDSTSPLRLLAARSCDSFAWLDGISRRHCLPLFLSLSSSLRRRV